MIDGSTALLHAGNFDTGKRTGSKRAVSECVYTGRLYYNPDSERIGYPVYGQPVLPATGAAPCQLRK